MRTLMFTHRRSAPISKKTSTAGTMGRANVYEKEDQYLLQVAVPGIQREDISITTQDNRLDITCERKSSGPEESTPGGVFLGDRIDRSFHFSSKLDDAGIQASVANGLLTVVLPKTGARAIPVSAI